MTGLAMRPDLEARWSREEHVEDCRTYDLDSQGAAEWADPGRSNWSKRITGGALTDGFEGMGWGG